MTLVRVCSWCPDQEEQTASARAHGYDVTHFMCSACEEKLVKKWEQDTGGEEVTDSKLRRWKDADNRRKSRCSRHPRGFRQSCVRCQANLVALTSNGQGLIEYAVLVAFISLMMVGILSAGLGVV